MSELKKDNVLPGAVTPAQTDAMAEVVKSNTEPIMSMKKLAAAGVQFGHQMRKWNPKMAKFIYTSDRGIYIVDLKKTVVKIEEAYQKLKDIVANKGTVLFVGTNKKIQSIIKEEALRSGSFYINTRWLGGTLTNFTTILRRIRYLKTLEQQETDGTLDLLPKKEANGLRKMKEKLLRNFEGIKEIRGLPKAVFVVDPQIDHNAAAEARKLNIPLFGITDTNCDPDVVDYPIPGNDDAAGSVKLIVQTMADSVVEAKGGMPVVAYAKDDDVIAKIIAFKEANKLTEFRSDRPSYPRRPFTPRTGGSGFGYAGSPDTTKPVEAKVEAKVNVKVEAKVEVKPEVKVEAKVEVKPEPVVNTVPSVAKPVDTESSSEAVKKPRGRKPKIEAKVE